MKWAQSDLCLNLLCLTGPLVGQWIQHAFCERFTDLFRIVIYVTCFYVCAWKMKPKNTVFFKCPILSHPSICEQSRQLGWSKQAVSKRRPRNTMRLLLRATVTNQAGYDTGWLRICILNSSPPPRLQSSASQSPLPPLLERHVNKEKT